MEPEFKPLGKGLGFHPFSEGLPYSPSTNGSLNKPILPRQPTPAASGAMAAGPQIPVELLGTQELHFETQASEFPNHYMARRVAASFLDATFNCSIALGMVSAIVLQMKMSLSGFMDPQILTLLGVFLVVFNWAITTAQEVSFGTTLGKKIFGLAVEGSAARVFMRSLLYVAGMACFGLGLVPALFTAKRQCAHDLLTGIQPKLPNETAS